MTNPRWRSGRSGVIRSSQKACRRAMLNSSCDMSDSRRSEEHTSELQSRVDLVCRLLLEKKKKKEQHNKQHRDEPAPPYAEAGLQHRPRHGPARANVQKASTDRDYAGPTHHVAAMSI